jgi:hypothetical protein
MSDQRKADKKDRENQKKAEEGSQGNSPQPALA